MLSPLPGWSLQGCSQQAAGMWPPFLFRRRGLAHVDDSMALPLGREMGGGMDGSLLWSLVQAQPWGALSGS